MSQARFNGDARQIDDLREDDREADKLRLADIAERIKGFWEELQEHEQAKTHRAFDIGDELIEARKYCRQKRTWMRWIDDNCRFGYRMAMLFISLAETRADIAADQESIDRIIDPDLGLNVLLAALKGLRAERLKRRSRKNLGKVDVDRISVAVKQFQPLFKNYLDAIAALGSFYKETKRNLGEKTWISFCGEVGVRYNHAESCIKVAQAIADYDKLTGKLDWGSMVPEVRAVATALLRIVADLPDEKEEGKSEGEGEGEDKDKDEKRERVQLVDSEDGE